MAQTVFFFKSKYENACMVRGAIHTLFATQLVAEAG